MRQPVQSEQAPKPKAPYSQAIIASGRYLFISGQGPVDPQTGNSVGESFEAQATRTFENLQAVAEAAGASLKDFVKVNAYLNDMGNFAKYNEIYRRYFSEPYPARTTVHSALLGMMIEVDGIAVLGD
ncbi:MAG: Rid family detoxifying hydrolase [Pyrinomonadaceae bacterium]|nr:Rid family detoxifying hydrolase [Pyrinomonadaceae bacterium]